MYKKLLKENPHLVIIIAIMNSEETWRNAKNCCMGVGWGLGCLYSLRVSASQYLGKWRRKGVIVQWETWQVPHYSGDINYDGTNQYHKLPDGMQWEGHSITSVIFLPKMRNLNLIMKKHQNKKNNLGTVYKITGLKSLILLGS